MPDTLEVVDLSEQMDFEISCESCLGCDRKATHVFKDGICVILLCAKCSEPLSDWLKTMENLGMLLDHPECNRIGIHPKEVTISPF
jgi:hypothetical protein